MFVNSHRLIHSFSLGQQILGHYIITEDSEHAQSRKHKIKFGNYMKYTIIFTVQANIN